MKFLILAVLVLLCAAPAEAQVLRTGCEAAQLLPKLQECIGLLTQWGSGDMIPLSRSVYLSLISQARELELIKLRLQSLNAVLIETAHSLEN